MPKLTYQQEYDNAKKECDAQLAVVQPWLMQFTEDYNKDRPGAMGTCMYDNGADDKVRILTSPMGNFYWNTKEGQELIARQRLGEIGLYYVYGASSSFVIEYSAAKSAIFAYEGQLFQGVHREAVKAYFLYVEPYTNVVKKADVPMNVALAAQKLHSAQGHLSAVYGGMLEEKRRRW